MGDPKAVRLGPGSLLMAPLGSVEPTDLTTPWDGDWIALGYTDEGSNFVFDQTFEDVMVAEELDPIAILQTARTATVNFALAELTAANLQRAFNGGTITTPSGLIVFEPPSAGDYTEVMLGWESDDHMERWVFRKALQVGNVDIARRKAPNKATLPMSFRLTKPASQAIFKFVQDADYTPAGS